jgi:hypothetical protein
MIGTCRPPSPNMFLPSRAGGKPPGPPTTKIERGRQRVAVSVCCYGLKGMIDFSVVAFPTLSPPRGTTEGSREDL